MTDLLLSLGHEFKKLLYVLPCYTGLSSFVHVGETQHEAHIVNFLSGTIKPFWIPHQM